MKESALKNHRILIKNIENGELLADTKIIRFDTLANSVIISADSIAVKKHYNISAIVFAENSLYEFYGTMKGSVVENEVEVLLGKSKEKEDRKRTRYPVALDGYVNGIAIDGQMIALRKPIHIETINMSANGLLIKSDAGCFEIGDEFQAALDTEDKKIDLDCRVVRIHSNNMLTEEYGCKIREIRLL